MTKNITSDTLTVALGDILDGLPYGAPLHQIDGRGESLHAYIGLTEDGTLCTFTRYKHEGTPVSEWHGVTQTWRVPSGIRTDTLIRFFRDHMEEFEAVYLGHSVEWSGQNHVGVLDEAHIVLFETRKLQGCVPSCKVDVGVRRTPSARAGEAATATCF